MARLLKRRLRSMLRPITGAASLALLALASWLPLRVSRAVAAVGGHIVMLLPWERRLVLANLAVAFPDWTPGQRVRVGRRAMQNLALTYLELVWLQRRPQRLREFIEISPEAQQLMNSVASKGAILISPHIGNWELGFLALCDFGLPAVAVAAEPRNPYQRRLIYDSRTRLGASIIPQQGAARGILQALRNEQWVIMLIDQNTQPKDGGIFVDFFGLPVPVSRAPAMFARRAGVPVVIGTCRRQAHGPMRIVFEPLPLASRDYESDAALTADINRMTESLIRESPEQYLWLYRRWRYMPPEITPAQRARYPYYGKPL